MSGTGALRREWTEPGVGWVDSLGWDGMRWLFRRDRHNESVWWDAVHRFTMPGQ